MKRLAILSMILLFVATTAMAQMGRRFPSERKVIKDPKTGVELVFLTSKSGTGDSKIYQTHNQWTSDGKGYMGLAKVTEGDFDAQGEWHEGRWLNGDEIQLRYDLLYAVEEGFSGQGLNFGKPEPQFLKVELFNY